MAPRVSADEYTHEIEVQYRDLDPRAHVNHAVYVSYMEQAKGRYMADVLEVDLSEAGTVVGHLEVDFRSPVEPGETVSVAVRPVDVGETSFTLEYTLTVDGQVVATGTTVSVRLGEDGRPAALPEVWRDGLEPRRGE